MLLAEGHPEPRAVMFHGLSIGNPRQILDFPLDAWREIVTISNNCFTQLNPVSFLKAIEWHGNPLAWSWNQCFPNDVS